MDVAQWFRLLVAAILVCELVLRLPLLGSLRKVMAASGKAQKLLRSKRISDHWKERMLPRYALMIGGNSVLFFVLLCLALVPVVLIGFTDGAGMGHWLASLMTPSGLIGLFVLSLGYFALRARF